MFIFSGVLYLHIESAALDVETTELYIGVYSHLDLRSQLMVTYRSIMVLGNRGVLRSATQFSRITCLE